MSERRIACSILPSVRTKRASSVKSDTFSIPSIRRRARPSASRRSSATWGWSIIGKRAVGPTCAVPSASTISPASEGMGNFFAELKRRHMYRIAAAYAVVAWVLLQLINNLAQALKLPDWLPATVVVLLALGFPVTLLFAWIQQMAPADGTAREAKTTRLDWILVGGIATVIAIFLFQQFAFGPTAVTETKGVDAAKSAADSPAAAVSIAVLPFSNLSADADQEFFSDGITEEITAALAKVPDL